jgi:PadR family transcriptional regulator PadR
MTFLTKLEELFLLAVFHHHRPVHLIDIRKYLLAKTGKDWAIASLYIALDKLKKKGFVKSFIGEPQHVRGGKALRYYLITGEGVQALEDAWKSQATLWKDFVSFLGQNEFVHE